MTVSTILKTKGNDVVSVGPEDLLSSVVDTLASRRIGAVLVLDSAGAVAGIMSERDIVRALSQDGPRALDKPVRQFMTADVVHAAPSDSIASVMEKMTLGRFRHLPILDGGRVAGIISIGDVVKRRIDDALHEAEALREYVASAG
jgi:CBS domain-containing protein